MLPVYNSSLWEIRGRIGATVADMRICSTDMETTEILTRKHNIMDYMVALHSSFISREDACIFSAYLAQL